MIIFYLKGLTSTWYCQASDHAVIEHNLNKSYLDKILFKEQVILGNKRLPSGNILQFLMSYTLLIPSDFKNQFHVANIFTSFWVSYFEPLNLRQ